MIKKITQKKEFSELPEKDVELAFEKFDKDRNADYQKLKLTRNFLRRIYSSFGSRKLLSPKDKHAGWFLMKHKSTKERLPYYCEIYNRIFEDLKKDGFSVIDLGAGVNGLSYNHMICCRAKHCFGKFPKEDSKLYCVPRLKINYVGVEAIGQLVDLMNRYFKKHELNAKAVHESLLELDKIKKIIKRMKKPKIVFMFKVVDSLELLQRNYTKEFLLEIVPLCDKVVLSFATRSLGRRTKFSATRGWLLKFISENFDVIDNFEYAAEKYVVFKK